MKYHWFCLLLLCSAGISAQMVGDVDYGLASYYSDEYEGAQTAYGETYRSNTLVAAHKLYPYNSRVRVTNTENGQSVVVRIVDKGPFIRGRIIELSRSAAERIGLVGSGRSTAQVEVTLLSTPDQPANASTDTDNAPPPPPPVDPQPTPAPILREPVTPAPAPRPEPRQESETAVATRPATTPPAPAPRPQEPAETSPTPAPAAPPSQPVARPTSTVEAANRAVVKQSGQPTKPKTNATFAPGLYKIMLLEPPAGEFGVQVGSFNDIEHAMDKVSQLQAQYFDNILVQKVNADPASVYKVILGPFTTQDSAKNYASDLKSRYKMAGFTVRLPQN